MADTRLRLQGLIPSAEELNETGWPQWVIEDYLNILRNIVELADTIDENEETNLGEASDIDTAVSQLRASQNAVARNLADEESRISDLIAENGILRAKINALEKRLADVEQGVIDGY